MVIPFVYTEEEYKKLEEENRNLKNELMEDMKTESKLNEEIRNLKSELSKFRDSFKKYRDYEKEELAESCYDLARENEKLKEELKKDDREVQVNVDKELLKANDYLIEENKKLKEERDKYYAEWHLRHS